MVAPAGIGNKNGAPNKKILRKKIDFILPQIFYYIMTSCDGSCVSAKAVKAQYGKSNGLVKYLNDRHTEKDRWVLEMLSDDLKWDYVKKFGIQMAYIGKSEIKPYTNKKGHTSMAHFCGSTYIGSVKKLGDKPVECAKYEVPYKPMWSIIRGKFKRAID